MAFSCACSCYLTFSHYVLGCALVKLPTIFYVQMRRICKSWKYYLPRQVQNTIVYLVYPRMTTIKIISSPKYCVSSNICLTSFPRYSFTYQNLSKIQKTHLPCTIYVRLSIRPYINSMQKMSQK